MVLTVIWRALDGDEEVSHPAGGMGGENWGNVLVKLKLQIYLFLGEVVSEGTCRQERAQPTSYLPLNVLVTR